MTPEAQRIAIAKLCGWTRPHLDDPRKPAHMAFIVPNSTKGQLGFIPDYIADLNAMHEAEMTLGNDEITWGKYSRHLFDIIEPHRHTIHATAAQRAEAFLRTAGKWQDTK